MDSSWVKYTYDSLGQLLQENYSDGTTNEYQYDELGNRTKVINNSGTTNYTYNTEKNRLVSVGSNNYTYDANGNVTSDGTYTYIWGDDNKLKEVKQGTTTIASFTYDALGRRETMTDTNGVTKTFHYDGDQVTYVTQSDGKIYRFAYDHSGKPIFMSYNNNQYWYHYDQHGNVIRMTDVNGTTVAQYKYDAWGNITYPLGTGIEIQDLNPYRYAGYWYDRDIDKYYLKARYYDASIGRFLSKDPLEVRIGDSLSLNAYTYGENNPVMLVDPSGLVAELDFGGGGYTDKEWNKKKWEEFREKYSLNGIEPLNYVPEGEIFKLEIPFGPGNIAKGIKYARYAGEIGEAAAGITKTKIAIDSLTKTAVRRIPDEFDEALGIIKEVKNVKYQRYTNQIKDFYLYAKMEGMKFILVTRQGTTFSKELKMLLKSGEIIHKFLPW